MKIKHRAVSVDYIAVDAGLFQIRRYLAEKYGTDQSYQDIEPLKWYIGTGRASVDFLRKMLTAKPYMVARKLHKGGTYDEVIERVKDYIGFDAE